MKKRFKVGDKIFDVTAPETRAILTRYNGDSLYVILGDGSCGEEDVAIFKRTGRRFKLQKMLDEQVQEYTGIIIAIIHRYDDVEEKWVVAPEGMIFTKEEIKKLTYFQEQYFKSEIRM